MNVSTENTFEGVSSEEALRLNDQIQHYQQANENEESNRNIYNHLVSENELLQSNIDEMNKELDEIARQNQLMRTIITEIDDEQNVTKVFDKYEYVIGDLLSALDNEGNDDNYPQNTDENYANDSIDYSYVQNVLYNAGLMTDTNNVSMELADEKDTKDTLELFAKACEDYKVAIKEKNELQDLEININKDKDLIAKKVEKAKEDQALVNNKLKEITLAFQAVTVTQHKHEMDTKKSLKKMKAHMEKKLLYKSLVFAAIAGMLVAGTLNAYTYRDVIFKH